VPLGQPFASGSQNGRGVNAIALNGTNVATSLQVVYESSATGDSYTVVVRDLRTGAVLVDVRPSSAPCASGSYGALDDMVLAPAGVVAWIAYNPAGVPLGSYEVCAASPRLAPEVLASGTNIAPNSLALAGQTLYWAQGGVPQAAVLP
jgi:hypothetical protein